MIQSPRKGLLRRGREHIPEMSPLSTFFQLCSNTSISFSHSQTHTPHHTHLLESYVIDELLIRKCFWYICTSGNDNGSNMWRWNEEILKGAEIVNADSMNWWEHLHIAFCSPVHPLSFLWPSSMTWLSSPSSLADPVTWDDSMDCQGTRKDYIL